MPARVSRRDALKQLGVIGARPALDPHLIRGAATDITIAGHLVIRMAGSTKSKDVEFNGRPVDIVLL